MFRNGWLGRYTYNPLLLCKGHKEACRKPKGLLFYISISSPAISLPPMGQLHSWLLSSDAYGICHASFDYLTKFLSPTKNRLSPYCFEWYEKERQIPSPLCDEGICWCGAGGNRTRVRTRKPYAFYMLIPDFGFRASTRPGPPIDTLSSEFHRAAEAQHDYFRFTCTAEPSDSEQHPWSDVSFHHLVTE